jgi:hypothetical protein
VVDVMLCLRGEACPCQSCLSDDVAENMKLLVTACLISVLSSAAEADWKVQRGRTAGEFLSSRPATVATVDAEAPANGGVTARLQLECFKVDDLSGMELLVVLSRETTPGRISWHYQFDDGPTVTWKDMDRLSLTSLTLDDTYGAVMLSLLPSAKRLRLTLQPPDSEYTYEFDVSGAAPAIKSLGCKKGRQPRW